VHVECVHEPKRIDDDVALSAHYAFAAVVASGPPVSIVFTDCERVMTELGVGSRSSFLRISVRSASWIFSRVPSRYQRRTWS
jgi:hypothetical protein